jgi:lipoprotein-releasing system permease protein
VPDGVADRLRRAGGKVYTGCIPGRELVNYRIPKQERSEQSKDMTELLLARRGDKLVLTTLPVSRSGALGSGFGRAVTPRMMGFTVVDHFKSRLYKFDKEHIFIPFSSAQVLGEMGDLTGEDPTDPPRAHQIRVSLKDPARAQETIADLERMWATFRQHPDRALNLLGVQPSMLTWEDRQATILQVVNTERTLMIILLGLVIVIAGFLIGAILTMIVKEKTRDIGILKSLGASNVGAAQIFLLYAALVSTVGALLGLLAALVFIDHIDGIRELVSRTLGFEVFSPEAYYFDKIPRYVDPWFTAAAVAGAVVWAVLCSAIAAYRAARLQPVEALRHE